MSLTHIIPIVEHVLQRGSGHDIYGITIYPMNTLANSQCHMLIRAKLAGRMFRLIAVIAVASHSMAEIWHEQGESPNPYEREALAWVRSWFPDHEPWRAFARFTFPGADGRDHEIDLLVAGPTGCFLIEFKGHEGCITGDARDLVSTSNARRNAFEHPKRLLKLGRATGSNFFWRGVGT